MTNRKDVVDRVHAVDLAQQLVHHCVVYASARAAGATLLANSVDLVKDDNVQLALVAPLCVFLLCVCEEVPHVLLRLTDVLVQHLRTVDHLGFPAVQHLANLPRKQGLASSWRAVEEDALHVVDAKLSHDRGGEHSRGESPPEDVAELVVQASNAHRLEVPVRPEQLRPLLRASHSLQRQARALRLREVHHRLRRQQAPWRVGLGGVGEALLESLEVDDVVGDDL
mmetsp:Transcript_18751/g.72315  ORF Transcript_18751/g.72315 Transcript_18751/m.72315 type:complete len:225 (+) Transcript_18751:1-675(+)